MPTSIPRPGGSTVKPWRVYYTVPATLLWRDAATAREQVSHALTPDGRSYDLLTAVLETLAAGGMDVALA